VLLLILIYQDTVFQEHVIVQLQEETNTVGEYITIYQYQRQQQRKRLEEKERQLQIVSRDREDLKTKLSQLQHLVTSFVHDVPNVDKLPQLESKPSPDKDINGPSSNHNGWSSHRRRWL
jgi:golgin subfamily A member 2